MTLFLIILITTLIIFVVHEFGYRRKQVQLASSLVLSLGILGTFIGISIALFYFDTKTEIKDSIGYFIDALRLAFITSVIGIAANLFIRIFIKIPTGDDAGELLYHQLSFLEKLYRRIDDMHTMMMPTSPNYVAPPHELLMVSELEELNKNLVNLVSSTSMSMSTSATTENNQSSHFQAVNLWIEEHLSDSFEKLRRDLSIIATSMESYPAELRNFQEKLKKTTSEIHYYNKGLIALDEKMFANKAGVHQLADAFAQLNGEANTFIGLQSKIDSFFLTMNEVVASIDNKESIKILRYLREQYSRELKSELGSIEFQLQEIRQVLKLSSLNKKEFV